MKILFLNGWHSVVGGVKPTYLKEHGHNVLNPALDDDDFDLSVQTAQTLYDQHRPDAIVGSSRGGAIAMNIKSEGTPLVLLCPAWKNWGSANSIKPNSAILHSRLDEVIPFTDSLELIANSGLSEESLFEVGSDHRLADDASLSVMLWTCKLLASGDKIPILDSREELTSMSAEEGIPASHSESSYVCDSCGEEIIIPLDISEGTTQSYVEDCPVCCRANMIHVHIEDDGSVQIWAEPEQDYD